MRKRRITDKSGRAARIAAADEAHRMAEEERSDEARRREYDRQEERGIDRWRGLE